MRLLILLGIVYLCYRFLKSWILQNQPSQKTGEIEDLMVKDPYCEVYFPKKDGVHLKIEGKDVYFCSGKCRDKFLEKQTKG